MAEESRLVTCERCSFPTASDRANCQGCGAPLPDRLRTDIISLPPRATGPATRSAGIAGERIEVKAPTRIGGWDLPAGVLVVPAIHLTHRLPDLYPAPEQFRLERFLDKKIDPYAWLPFGGGIRRCVGMAFALHELKVVTATLLRERALRLAKENGARRTALRGITHAPRGSTRVIVA